MNKYFSIYQLFPTNGYLMHSYVIKTPNDKIIVIDGGNEIYMEKPYIHSAIRAILGINQNDYFDVDAWFITHGHNDHYGEISKLFNSYDKDSNFKVKNFYFDFPDFINSKFSVNDYRIESIDALKNGLDNYAKVNKINTNGRYYDMLNGSVINSQSVKNGLTITIDGIDFEILQTYDEIDDDQINGNSLIIKVQASNKSKSCLFLGDASEVSGERLLRNCGDKVKSDIVQMSHHGQAGVTKSVYDAVGATLRLWPTPKWVWSNATKFKIGEVRDWFGTDEFSPNKNNYLVACLYESYPNDPTSVEDWKKCIDYMKIDIEIE